MHIYADKISAHEFPEGLAYLNFKKSKISYFKKIALDGESLLHDVASEIHLTRIAIKHVTPFPENSRILKNKET